MDPTDLQAANNAPFGHILTRFMHHSLVMVGVKVCTGFRIDGHHTLSIQDSAHFVTNQLHSREDRFHRNSFGILRERQINLIEHAEQRANDIHASGRDGSFFIFQTASLEVLKIRQSTLPSFDGFSKFGPEGFLRRQC